MRDANGFGSVTFFKFNETKTAKGKERIKVLYDLFKDSDDLALIQKFSWGEESEYDSREEYLAEMADMANLKRISNEPCELKWTDAYSFTVSIYTFYDTPGPIWNEIARLNKYVKAYGHVTRTYENEELSIIDERSELIISGGEFYYTNPIDSNEEIEFEDSL